MSCTSCHSGGGSSFGQIQSEFVQRQLLSRFHQLGVHQRRTGAEQPAVVAPIMLPLAQSDSSGPGVYTPHRLFWASYWGLLGEGSIVPLEPETTFQITKKTLKIKRDFEEEIGEVKPTLNDRKKLLGDKRAPLKETEWTADEKQKVDRWVAEQSKLQVDTRIADSLAEIQKLAPQGKEAVYVTGGIAFRRGKGEGELLAKVAPAEAGESLAPTTWPLGHNVRPARMALGANGCLECHSETAPFFSAKVTATGLLPGKETAVVVAHQLQGVDRERLKQWNSLFSNRTTFKFVSFACLIATGLIVGGCVFHVLGKQLSGHSGGGHGF
jgi:hypothetical protein